MELTQTTTNSTSKHTNTSQLSSSQFQPILTYRMIISNISLWIVFIIFMIDIIFIQLYVTVPIFVLCYVIYIVIFCYTSPILLYLDNKLSNLQISERMLSHFTKPPKITLSMSSYHMDKDKKKRIYTYKENINLLYYSWKDISGLFVLNKDFDSNKHKFLLLQINKEIEFADAISINDYQKKKKKLYLKNIQRDKCLEEREIRSYENYNQFNLVKINEKDSFFYQKGMFIFFLICSLGMIYCMLFNRNCIQQIFTVRKIISTRYNLMKKDNLHKFSSFRPMLAIKDNIYEYKENEIGSVYKENKIAAPTYEDLLEASVYENNVPKYYCDNYINNIGIVHSENAPGPAGEVEKDISNISDESRNTNSEIHINKEESYNVNIV